MVDERGDAAILESLAAAGIEVVVVGGTAAVLQGAPIITDDLDVVHLRTPENVDRLLQWLHAHDAYHRFDLMQRRLPPTRAALLGSGQLNLTTDMGKLDVLCELAVGEGYEQIIDDTLVLPSGVRVLALARLIRVKAAANRAKDRAVLPVLIATLDDLRRRG